MKIKSVLLKISRFNVKLERNKNLFGFCQFVIYAGFYYY